MLGWHFSFSNRRLGYGDNREIVAGKTLSVVYKPELCVSGLHASKSILDALRYAPGPYVWRVDVTHDLVIGDDKFVGSSRKALWGIDATSILQRFARLCASDVLHLWDAPEVVVDFLKSGDMALRKDATNAAAYAATNVDAYAAAAYAANAAAYAANAAAYAANAAYAAYAAYAAAYAAYSAANAAARLSVLRQCEDIIRNFYPQPPEL